MKKIYIFGLFLQMMLLLGCASSKVTCSWKSISASPVYKGKILVLALLKEEGMRLEVEKAVVKELMHNQWEAISSADNYGQAAFNKLDESSALFQLENERIDLVLTVALLEEQHRQMNVPGQSYCETVSVGERFWGYASEFYNTGYKQGLVVESVEYIWETNLYNSRTQELLYTVRIISWNTTRKKDLAAGYAKVMFKDIVKRDILKAIIPPKGF